MGTMVATVILFTILVLKVQSISEAECEYKVDLENGIHAHTRLMNHVLLNETVNHPMLCFSKCVYNCLCESFNFCGNRCELSSSTKESTAADYKNEVNCMYYDLKRVDKSELTATTSCDKSSKLFCCRHNNPCLNGGECIGSCPEHGKRFVCKCKNGYHGYICQVFKPATCQDYWTVPKPSTGIYTVYDSDDNTYKVFCDFDSEEGIAWTLVTSCRRDQTPVRFGQTFTAANIDSPGSEWADYHLSNVVMSFVSQKSTHWRVTCEYNTLGVDYVDYMRSKINETSLLTYQAGDLTHSQRCRKVEYANIRGRQCEDCTVGIHQDGAYSMHIPHFVGSTYGCYLTTSDFAEGCGNHVNEHYFGYFKGEYGNCVTGHHRCAATSDSTTQFWFGGKS